MMKSINLARIHKIILASGLFFTCVLATAYIYRDDIFQSIQDPGQPFQTYTPPSAPDYTHMDAWLAQPDLKQDPYTETAKGDVFVVVPSVYRGGEHWNLPSDDLKRKSKLQRIVRPNYVSPYGQAGRLFAPYYRQASLYSFMTAREDAVQAQDFAYQDVKRAFQVFLKNSPPERPIVLVGHNQGASHVQRLLKDFFQSPLKNRLAVAYVIDYPLPLQVFDTSLSALKLCETETDTGCVVSFGTFTPKDRIIADRYTTKLLIHDGQDYKAIAGREIACMNPLVWQSHEDYVPRRLHKGGVAAEGLEPDIDPAPLTKQVGAQCQDGLLLVDKPRSRSLRRPLQVGAKFRTLPSNLFYEDLKQNAVMRVNMLLKNGTLPKRTEKLDGFDVIDVIESPVGTITDVPTKPIKP
ncbi:MAG: DUF3089 domain-containing protein [Litorimonas sp.]